MASNSFGTLFRITTWGESHGPAIGVVIDGCPPNLPLSEKDIQPELDRRSPGHSPYTSPRKEEDQVEILSGVFEGVTTGAPISLIIRNNNIKSSAYEPIKDLLRPGHANFTYLAKYGVFDYRGGGRASARETACRVAAGAIAKKILSLFSIDIIAYIKEIGGIGFSDVDTSDLSSLKKSIYTSPIFCPDPSTTDSIIALIEKEKQEGDSLGGIVECQTFGLPVGLGDPVYEKLEAVLAKGMLSIPASKGIEFGEGFHSAAMRGSTHNDCFTKDSMGKIITKTNHAGGTLGGISTGMPLVFKTAFKPTSSIRKEQETVSLEGNEGNLKLPLNSRHDPCIAIRAVPVVEAMTALTLVDALLFHNASLILNFLKKSI
ncbi:MAG: chorismate synthase [Chlamydiota bacterium]